MILLLFYCSFCPTLFLDEVFLFLYFKILLKCFYFKQIMSTANFIPLTTNDALPNYPSNCQERKTGTRSKLKINQNKVKKLRSLSEKPASRDCLSWRHLADWLIWRRKRSV